MDITINGTANAAIIKPAFATPRENFAAEEFQKYIRRITGATLPIRLDNEDISGNMIIIGGPERNIKTAEIIGEDVFDGIVPGPEGLLIKTFGEGKLLLTGSSKNPYEYERGTLYAVYEFLETYLGCSFAAYGNPDKQMGDYIPKISTVSVDNISYVKENADNWYRTAIVQYYNTEISPTHGLNFAFIDWLAKNRYNRILTMASIYEEYKINGMFEEAKKRGILFSVGHHESSMLFLPPDGNEHFAEHFYETHPEYYKLQKDGTRFHSLTKWKDQWIFCSRNENAINQIAENIVKWLDKNPYVDVVTLWPNDSKADQCCCSMCSSHSKVENYCYFVNEVSKIVACRYPNVKIDMLIYIDLWKYPEGMKLNPSLLVDASTWHNSGLRYVGKKDGSNLIGTLYEKDPMEWAQAGATVVYYDYYMGIFGANQRYMPMADELKSIYSYFKSTGYCKGSGTQIEPFNLWNNILNHYVHGRTGYDSSISMEKNLDRFCRIFGRGASYLKGYILYAESVLDGQERINDAGKYFAQNIDRVKVYKYFEDAYYAVDEGLERNNIRMLRMAFRYTDLEVNGNGENELRYLYKNFDSFTNDPGYGIFVANEGAEGNFEPDGWYEFYSGNINCD